MATSLWGVSPTKRTYLVIFNRSVSVLKWFLRGPVPFIMNLTFLWCLVIVGMALIRHSML